MAYVAVPIRAPMAQPPDSAVSLSLGLHARTTWIAVVAFVLLGCGLLSKAAHGATGDYPARTVRVVIPYAPGGGYEVISRILLQSLGDALNQQFLHEYRPGAATTIGTTYVVRAAPDGYTLLIASTTTAANPAIYRNLPYDAEKDLEPVVMLTSSSSILCVHPSMPAKNLKQFISYARSNPGKLNYGHSGTGGSMHLNVEDFSRRAGIRMTDIPYTGGAVALTALVSGQVDVMLSPGSFSYPLIKSGKIRGIALNANQRSKNLPELPTFREEGFDSLDTSWSALFAPKGTPREIILKLNSEINKVLRSEAVSTYYQERFLVPIGGTPDMQAARLRADIIKWRKLTAEIGFKMQ